MQFHAQDVIGEDGIFHQSDAMPLAVPVVVPPDPGQVMVLHVHQPSVLVQRYSKHQGGKPVEEVGYIAVGDLVYVPQP